MQTDVRKMIDLNSVWKYCANKYYDNGIITVDHTAYVYIHPNNLFSNVIYGSIELKGVGLKAEL